MFTGIVKGTARIEHISEAYGGKDFVLQLSDTVQNLSEGQSVALDGVCLTVAEVIGRTVRFRVMNESLSKTTLGYKQKNDSVNVEPSLTLADEVGGHFVYGHVDGSGTIQNIERDGDNRFITLALPRELDQYMMPHGAVTVDGISLTIARQTRKQEIGVSIIPYTWDVTNLHDRTEGEYVNIEADMTVKTVVSYLQRNGY